MTAKIYKYRGWTYQQVRRGHWVLERLSDGFRTWHNSHGGCLSFIKLHGWAKDPDAHCAGEPAERVDIRNVLSVPQYKQGAVDFICKVEGIRH